MLSVVRTMVVPYNRFLLIEGRASWPLVKTPPAVQEFNFWVRKTRWRRGRLPLQCSWASLVAQPVKNLPAMQDPWVGKIPWRRALQPTPEFLPGESHGQRILLGCSPWGHRESDMTERLSMVEVKQLKHHFYERV